MKKGRIVVVLVVGFMVTLMMAPAFADTIKEANAFGKTYGEWSARWWKFVHSIPSARNPLVDTTGENCAVGQLAPGNSQVWFLVGTKGGDAERSCTVPRGKALFFPLVNADYVDDVGEGVTEAEKRAALAEHLDSACDLTGKLDGESTIISQSIVRTQSPAFSLVIGEDDVYGFIEGGVDNEAVADGYWVMLPPLSKGEHVLEFTGARCDPENPFNVSLLQKSRADLFGPHPRVTRPLFFKGKPLLSHLQGRFF